MNDSIHATFWHHVEELRHTLLRVVAIIVLGMAISACFYSTIFQFITAPVAVGEAGVPQLIILKPTEGITIAIKVCFWTGLVGTSPLWLIQLLQFILPALEAREKQGLVPFFLAIIVFFALGGSFSYFVTIPIANHYLALFNNNMGINMWTLSNYIDYSFLLILGNGLAFEIAVILFFLVHYRWISPQTLREKRRYYIVAAFIFSAIITPPDVITQLTLALPLTLLYELAIVYAKLREYPVKQTNTPL